MFDTTSRYYRIEDATYETGDGRRIVYKHRRFLPEGEELPLYAEFTVRAGDRLDLIAARAYNQPEQFWRICDANNAIDPNDLIEESDRTLRVPIPQA